MKVLALELTNLCNRACHHCFRNKADPPGFLPPAVADRVLSQAKPLGFKVVCLTGGEVGLYPHLKEVLRCLAARGFAFSLVTNGYRFPGVVLPLLLEPAVRERLTCVSFSLDGATAAVHDGLRGLKSFREVLEAMTCCQRHGLPMSLKTVLTTANRGELTELVLLGARMGVREHGFLFPYPRPNFIRSGLLPGPEETEATLRWIRDELLGITRHAVTIDGYAVDGPTLNCGHLVDFLNVDFQGHLIFCCTLSHINQGDGVPTTLGGECLADLKEISLPDAIVKQYQQAAAVLAARFAARQPSASLAASPCFWVLEYFGKLDWLKEFPDSPWHSWIWPRQ